jgi:preprotein translocase subunit YajC
VDKNVDKYLEKTFISVFLTIYFFFFLKKKKKKKKKKLRGHMQGQNQET